MYYIYTQIVTTSREVTQKGSLVREMFYFAEIRAGEAI